MSVTDGRSLVAGQRVAERFVVLEKLGQGGTATVFRARDVESGEIVAIKHLTLGLNQTEAEQANRITRFENEARTMLHMDHPYIMSVHEFLEADGEYYMIAELLDGLPLQEYLAANTIPVRETLIYLAQVAQALDYAHTKNIIHRDVKPENVMVMPGKGAKLLDFGIAKFEYNSQLTTDGTILGTVAYMSPEQLKNSRTTTHQSDIYSFGIMMYEVFTGKLPFNAETPGAAVVQIFSQTPTPPIDVNSEIGQDLNQLILTCMHKQAELRYASCQQIQRTLQELIKQVYTPGAVVNAQTPSKLPRIRCFENFQFLQVVTTLCEKEMTGLCMVWSSFQETNIYIDQGHIRQVAMKHREIEPEQGFYDVICWPAGNFCFLPSTYQHADQFDETPTSLMLNAAEMYLTDFKSMWESYNDSDIPEISMKPGKSDKLSSAATALMEYIDDKRCIGQLYALIRMDRLTILQGLQQLEDRQFIFVERIRD